jgi:hypothetical protein
MTEITWGDLREQGRLAFGGQTPGRQLEADLVEAFERHPGEVEVAITMLEQKFAAGKIHSPWPIVLREVQGTEAKLSVVADPTPDRERRARLAETWIRNAGCYEPNEESLLAALFDSGGLLHPWQHQAEMRRRMVEVWLHHHPSAEQADAAMVERAGRWQRQWQATIDEQDAARASQLRAMLADT